MNIGTRSSIVVEGEASESDEESASPAVQSVNKLRQDAPAQQVPVDTFTGLKLRNCQNFVA